MFYSNITFICPCYNHEKYLLEFLGSLVKQTNCNWELIIIDDCSSDKSVDVINSVKDRRITFIKNSFNRGINANVSRGILQAKTELISFVASDDVLYPDYVETVLSVFNDAPDVDVCYTPLQHINENGALINSVTTLPYSFSEHQILEKMFLDENLLPSPGMAFKKRVFTPYLPLDFGIIQYSDYQMHFFVLLDHKIKMLESPLVLYRVTQNSTSSRSKAVLLREKIETEKLMNSFVRLVGDNLLLFNKIFSHNKTIVGNKVTNETILYWLGRIALLSSNKNKQEWGLSVIMNYISNDKNVRLLHELYGFSYKEYLKMAEFVVSGSTLSEDEIKIKKYKSRIKKLQFSFVSFIITSLFLFIYILLV